MKSIALMGLLLAFCANLWAGELEKVNFQGKFVVTEGCNDSECFSEANVKLRFQYQVNLTSSEAAAFSDSTTLNLEAPLFPVELDLDEVPGFNTGDTSINYTTNTLEGTIPIQQTWKVDWSANKLTVDYSLTAKGRDVGPHTEMTAWVNTKATDFKVASSNKSHGLPGLEFGLVAENSGSEFLAVGGLLICDASSGQIEAIDKKGTLTSSMVQHVKGNKFLPLLSVP